MLYPYQKAALEMLMLHDKVGMRQGKSLTVVAFCKFALTRHPTVIVATNNQARTLTKLREHFPKHLMSLVEEWGVRIHRMKE